MILLMLLLCCKSIWSYLQMSLMMNPCFNRGFCAIIMIALLY